MMSLSFVVFPAKAQARPKLFVEPSSSVFSTDTTSVGAKFSVTVSTSGWEAPGLWGFDFKLFFDNTLLAATTLIEPADFFLKGSNVFASVIDNATGFIEVSYAYTTLKGVTGAGPLATVEFEIIKAPPTAKSVSCDLRLQPLQFLDPNEVEYAPTMELTHGYYEFAAPRPPMPYFKVLPEFASAKTVGDQVLINITIRELGAVWKAVAFQWKLIFDPTVLAYVNATEGDFLKKFGSATFFAIQEADYVISFSLLFKDPWPPEVFPDGSGTLATLEFTAATFGSCDLTLAETMIVDVDGNLIDQRTPQHGKFSITPPWLSVSPKEYTANERGKEFDLTVLINELKADWMMVGAEFKIRYNSTLLDLVNITEGGFMKRFAMLSGVDEPYTWFQWYNETDPVSKYGIVGILILPMPNGTYPGPFPDTDYYGAPGDLVTAKFKAIYQHETLDVTDEKAIWLNDILMVNKEAQVVPYDTTKTAVEGKCKYTITKRIPPFAGFLDLMTQYPDPWSGEGKDAASDAFPPQGVVELRGLVTYRGDVVPGKPVSYAIKAPTGETYFGTYFTQADGIAVFAYSLPASNGYFGLWTVEASVDLAGTIISDKLYFLMGWLIEVAEIQPPAEAYKGETMNINVKLTRICMQDPRDIMDTLLKDSAGAPILGNDLLLHITVTDELKQLVGTSTLNTSAITEISGIDLNVFVNTIGNQWSDRIAIISTDYPALTSIVMNGIPISAAAFSGTATIRANVLTDLPGVAYCPEGLKTVQMKKRT